MNINPIIVILLIFGASLGAVFGAAALGLAAASGFVLAVDLAIGLGLLNG